MWIGGNGGKEISIGRRPGIDLELSKRVLEIGLVFPLGMF